MSKRTAKHCQCEPECSNEARCPTIGRPSAALDEVREFQKRDRAKRKAGHSLALNEYLFDVKLFASVRVKALSVVAARKVLNEAFDCASINAGAWPNGDPVLCEASQDGRADLIEINGEDVA